MAVVRKRLLTESEDGKAILVAANATPGTDIHTATGVSVDGSYDEVWLWAQNGGPQAVVLCLEWGGTSVPADVMRFHLPVGGGLIPIVPGFILHNGKEIAAFASLPNVVSIIGFVNAITD